MLYKEDLMFEVQMQQSELWRGDFFDLLTPDFHLQSLELAGPRAFVDLAF